MNPCTWGENSSKQEMYRIMRKKFWRHMLRRSTLVNQKFNLRLPVALSATLVLLASGFASVIPARAQQSENKPAKASEQRWQALEREANKAHEAGRYTEAERLHLAAIQEAEKHPSGATRMATSLNNLAMLHAATGRYQDAESRLKRALTIYENALGPDHPETASILVNLGSVYYEQERYPDAAAAYRRSLPILENALGPDHPVIVTTLNNLAEVYRRRENYSEAEALYRRVLVILDKAPNEDPRLASALNNLGLLYADQERHLEAERFHRRALQIWQNTLGTDHPLVAAGLNNLAELFLKQGRDAEAGPLFERAVDILIKAFGPEHPDLAKVLRNLALSHYAQGNIAAAEVIRRRLENGK